MIPPTSQNLNEFGELLKIYMILQPKYTLEIGTHEGGTLYYWLQNAVPGSVVGSIDNQGIISESQAKVWAAPRVKALCYRGDSTEQQAIDWARNNIGTLDWLFIDGGHDYDTVKSDWENYSPLVRRGGTVAFHDILPHPACEVDKLWSEIKENYAGVQEIIEPHTEWGFGPGIGIVYL